MTSTRWKVFGLIAGFILLAIIFIAQVQHARTEPPAPTGPVAGAAGTLPPTPTSTSTTTMEIGGQPATGHDDVDGKLTDREGLLKTANGFARAFADQGKDWKDRVSEWCVKDLADKLATIDPDNLPETGKVAQVSITGPSEPVAVVDVLYSSGLAVRLYVIYSPGGWKVMQYDKL